MISIINYNGQFGQKFPQNLVLNFSLNGAKNPGRIEDGGMNLYPERYIESSADLKDLPGVKSIWVTTSLYENGTNHFYLRFNLENDFYKLKDFSENNVVVLGDGEMSVKLRTH